MIVDMDTEQILEGLESALSDGRTLKGVAQACGINDNSLSQFRGPKRSLGAPLKAKLAKWLETEGYIKTESDPIEDSVGFLRKALEFAEKPSESRRKRAAVLLELLSLVERHFAAELREIGNGRDSE